VPKVKGKHYKYTKKGMAKAKKAAKKAGVKVQYKSKGGPMRVFIAKGCGKVMNKRRKKTKEY
tara:strand:- start:1252 stop:1437 length:186 start_codon:yes stop_codon:yes gene_type:complete